MNSGDTIAGLGISLNGIIFIIILYVILKEIIK